ncbi:DUF5682 family protein [Streptomyces sp. NPDC102264]|uniref:DUF5682 family protein n=1 Tax=Streptomyces sp. NPDC102264 TaxID=3366149 RepID=UPI0037F36206
MPAAFLGVRHHSPVCARLVARTITTLRPSHVLIEGPADMNDRLDELLLGHELPVAVFSHYRDAVRTTTSWTPFCAYSPEWVALAEGRAAGARVRFIDLPAWHPAFEGRSNRYADAEARYVRASARLRDRFGVDCADALWDRLFEAADPPDPADSPYPHGEDALAERLALYFDVLRGDAEADTGDRAREEYTAAWVGASLAEAGERPVLVVTGGFHRPALRALVERPAGGTPGRKGLPEVPRPPADAEAGSHLVRYSFHRLDAFTGYQSGMPSPGYHQDLWERGPRAAGDALAAWRAVFADYEILQPFRQLARPVLGLTPEEAEGSSLPRFQQATVVTGALLGLTKRGWQRMDVLDAGGFGGVYKVRGPNQVVSVAPEDGFNINDLDYAAPVRLSSVWIGTHWYPNHRGEVRFGGIDPLAASELLLDLADVLEENPG